MTHVAGETCDGFFVHPFTTRGYVDSVTLPALRRGREAAGLDGFDGFTVCGSTFVVVGRDDAELAAAAKATKERIAFYASTPAYRGVLETHGRGDLQPELTQLSREGRWAEMGDAVDDELLDLLAVVGDASSVAAAVAARWGDVYDRVSLDAPYDIDPGLLAEVAGAIQRAAS
jgi:probable F420-dependent oxidoreductase